MWTLFKHRLYIAFIGVMMKLAPGSSYMLFAGEGSSRQLCRHIARSGKKKVLIVTDKPLVELGITERASAGLAEAGVESAVYDGVLPDPSFEIVEAGVAVLREHSCDCILAIGGGSSIDAAKVMALAATNPGNARDYVGFAKAKEAPLPLYAIPTTSGTGSEATQGAVISDSQTQQKVIIADGGLLPAAAALDAALLTGLPPHITAATGMDALTHAVEAYISRWDAGDCMEKAAAAVRLLFEHLPVAYEDGANIDARDSVAQAAYMAGQAINQVNVGNVHAIAHQLGAIYHVPHGLANAQVMPHVLDMSCEKARPRLTELAQMIGCQSAEEFIAKVRELSAGVGIPSRMDKLEIKDFTVIVERAVAEGASYPVPHLMSPEDCTAVLRKLLPA
jgi:alcohol dehydrogenase